MKSVECYIRTATIWCSTWAGEEGTRKAVVVDVVPVGMNIQREDWFGMRERSHVGTYLGR